MFAACGAIFTFLLILCHIQYILSDSLSDIIDSERSLEFSWEVSGPYGGSGGEYFTDWWTSLDGTRQRPNKPPHQINIRYGGQVDSIQVMYGNYDGLVHGGHGGLLTRIHLYNGDRVVRVTGRRGLGPGAAIDQITLITKNGRSFGPYGGPGGVPFDAVAPREDCFLGYISGRAARRLDQLIVHWRCPSQYRTNENRPLYGYSKSSAHFCLGAPVLLIALLLSLSIYSVKMYSHVYS